mgnify:CR=1 FL=1
MLRTIAAVVGIGTFGIAQAQSAPASSVTIYGSVDVSVGISKTGSGVTLPGGTTPGAASTRVYRMDSGVGPGSRLGFRGTESLGGGMKASYLMEMGFATDSGALQQGGLGWGRQVFVGVGGDRWSVTLGRQYSPTNAAFAQSDALGGVYWGNMLTSAGQGLYASVGSAPGSGTFQSAGRVDNSLMLTVGDKALTGKLMLGAGNETARGAGRLISSSVAYAPAPEAQVLAAFTKVRTPESFLASQSSSPEWMTEWLLGGSYDLGVAKLYSGIYQFTGPKDRTQLSPAMTVGSASASPFSYSWDKTRSIWLGAKVPVSVGSLMVQVGRIKFDYPTGSDGKSTVFAATYEHALSKRTFGYLTYGQISNDVNARTGLFGAIPVVGPNGFGADPSALSLGLRHQF